jgi:hypothetical protein
MRQTINDIKPQFVFFLPLAFSSSQLQHRNHMFMKEKGSGQFFALVDCVELFQKSIQMVFFQNVAPAHAPKLFLAHIILLTLLGLARVDLSEPVRALVGGPGLDGQQPCCLLRKSPLAFTSTPNTTRTTTEEQQQTERND